MKDIVEQIAAIPVPQFMVVIVKVTSGVGVYSVAPDFDCRRVVQRLPNDVLSLDVISTSVAAASPVSPIFFE